MDSGLFLLTDNSVIYYFGNTYKEETICLYHFHIIQLVVTVKVSY